MARSWLHDLLTRIGNPLCDVSLQSLQIRAGALRTQRSSLASLVFPVLLGVEMPLRYCAMAMKLRLYVRKDRKVTFMLAALLLRLKRFQRPPSREHALR